MLLSDRYRAVSCDRSRSPHRFRREMPYRKREYGQMRSRRKREQSLIDPTKSHHYEQRKTIVPGHREIFESPHVGHRVRARDPDAPVDILARETQQPPRSDFQTRITNYQDFTGRQLVFLPDYNAFMDRLCSGKYQWNGFLINKYERLVDPKDPSVVYCCDKEYDDLYTLFFIFVSKIVWGRLLPWRRRRDEMTIFAFDDYPMLFTYRQAQLRA